MKQLLLFDSMFTCIGLQLDSLLSVSKESTCNPGDLGLIPGLGQSPGEGKGYPLLTWRIPWTSPWGHKQSDTTERLSLYIFTCLLFVI